MIGATQKSQSCFTAMPPTNTATAVERAGFTDVFVTGMLMRWMSVRQRPIAMGAKPAGARLSVAPMITKRNANVITISVMSAEVMPTVVPPNGLRPVSELRDSDQPFVAKAPIPALVRSGWAIAKRTPAAMMPPMTWATMYAGASLAGKRPPATRPRVTAGFRWQPEMWPMAKAMVSTVRPNASATPTEPMPIPEPMPPALQARTAAPQPPRTSQNVPIASAMDLFVRDIVTSFVMTVL